MHSNCNHNCNCNCNHNCNCNCPQNIPQNIGSDNTGPSRTGSDNTGPLGTGSDNAGPGRSGPNHNRQNLPDWAKLFLENLEKKKKSLEQLQKLYYKSRSEEPTYPSDNSLLRRFYPYLMIRSFLGDDGTRPLDNSLNRPLFSPDILAYPGESSQAPDVPLEGLTMLHAMSPETILASGAAYTLYAHVWNLGRAPIIGAKVEFYQYAPIHNTHLIDPTLGLFVGAVRVDLPPIECSTACHKLVKCPVTLGISPIAFTTGEFLTMKAVRVSGIGDPIGANSLDPTKNRHVAISQSTI